LEEDRSREEEEEVEDRGLSDKLEVDDFFFASPPVFFAEIAAASCFVKSAGPPDGPSDKSSSDFSFTSFLFFLLLRFAFDF
jgi:hypothetical protein